MDLIERNSSDDATRHPWEIARAEFLSRLTHPWIQPDDQVRWLDVGAGDGWLAQHLLEGLPDGSTITCWDKNYSEADLHDLGGLHPGLSFVAARPAEPFGSVLLLDVLEHVENDLAFLESVVQNSLLPGGLMFLTVPAYGRLYARHDADLLHFRRYEPRHIRHLIQRSGLTILRDGGLFTSLLPVRLAQVMTEKMDPRDHSTNSVSTPAGVGTWNGGPAISAGLRHALAADSRLSLQLSKFNLRLPGLSYWAVCRK